MREAFCRPTTTTFQFPVNQDVWSLVNFLNDQFARAEGPVAARRPIESAVVQGPLVSPRPRPICIDRGSHAEDVYHPEQSAARSSYRLSPRRFTREGYRRTTAHDGLVDADTARSALIKRELKCVPYFRATTRLSLAFFVGQRALLCVHTRWTRRISPLFVRRRWRKNTIGRLDAPLDRIDRTDGACGQASDESITDVRGCESSDKLLRRK